MANGKKEKDNYVGKGGSPYVSQGKGDTLAQKSWEPPGLVVPMKKVSRTNSRYLLRSRGGRGGDREHSVPATATPSAPKVCHPSQLLSE
eukprot:1160218-Pelagomonas_calceolata.AAC.9